jgi:hypothetical protein
MLALAQAALASGGSNSGSGGGGGGGTTTTPAPAPTPTGSCAAITSFSNKTGYRRNFSAIQTSFSIATSCSTQPNWEVTYSPNDLFVEVGVGESTSIESQGTVEGDARLFSTPYTVALTVTDPSTGALVASHSAVVTTPPPKG